MEFSQLPSTQDTLSQQVFRLEMHGKFYRTPTLYARKRVGDWFEPLWTLQSFILTEYNALLKCGCKNTPFCSNNCNVKRYGRFHVLLFAAAKANAILLNV